MQAQREKVERNKLKRQEGQLKQDLANKTKDQNTPTASPQMKSSIRMSERLAKVNAEQAAKENREGEKRIATVQIGDEEYEIDVDAPRQLRNRNAIKKPDTFAPENFKEIKPKPAPEPSVVPDKTKPRNGIDLRHLDLENVRAVCC